MISHGVAHNDMAWVTRYEVCVVMISYKYKWSFYCILPAVYIQSEKGSKVIGGNWERTGRKSHNQWNDSMLNKYDNTRSIKTNTDYSYAMWHISTVD